ncbi:MAG: NAD(P)-dependent oxidoreductase [Alphaproteobacteria bacterium]|nr:NAD(P)-dependent oxidoreductase [Alphaproteobacteria bacterium]
MSQQHLLKFVSREQESPAKRSGEERRRDFGEINATYPSDQANSQAGRCAQCGVPYCQIHCPVSNNIPDWLLMVANNRMEEAYRLSTATNTFPEICGRVCPQDRLCEGNCVIEQSGHGHVTIGSVEKYITEHAFANGWVKPIVPAQELSKKIAIIGAGPAGLSAAIGLRQRGYQIHIFDRYDRAGGLMIYGIPNFKLEKSVLLRRQQWLEQSGIHFHYGHDVGHDFAAIQKNHAAVIIATGVYKNRDLDITGRQLGGVVPALPFLIRENKIDLGDNDPAPHLSAKGKKVVVIGGGDTGMDCVRTAIRQGAEKVFCLYRRDRNNMPGSRREVKNAEEEGVAFMWLTAPTQFNGQTNLQSIDTIEMKLGEKGLGGRRDAVPVAGSAKNITADMAILALGFEAEDSRQLFQLPQLPLTRWGTIHCNQHGQVIDEHGTITMPFLYAGGDIVRGASLVVHAIADGMKLAEKIDQDLKQASNQKAA